MVCDLWISIRFVCDRSYDWRQRKNVLVKAVFELQSSRVFEKRSKDRRARMEIKSSVSNCPKKREKTFVDRLLKRGILNKSLQ